MSRRPAFAESWRGNKKYSLGKIGHHDEDAPQRNEHSKRHWRGPYYQTHVHSSMRVALA